MTRLSPRNWSLRTRLLAAVVTLVAAALVTTGTVGITLLRGYLVHQVDSQLNVGARVLNRPTDSTPPTPPTPPPQSGGQLPTPFWFTDLDTTGAVVRQRGGAGTPGEAKPDLSGVNAAKVRAEGGKAFTVPSTTGGAGFRVRAIANADGSGSRTVASSLGSANATVGRLETITWLVALLVLLVLAALAMLAVRLGLRPLENVERAAEDIAAGDLSRRVPPGPPGTEIGRLSETLNTMLTQIESAFAARSHSETVLRQFIADASHELRTPLTTVRGYAELARKGALTDEAHQRRAMARIEAEAARMGGLVEDLLLLAHLDEQRPLTLTTVDLCALTADAVADARVLAPGRPIDSRGPDGPVFVDVDADRMRQVLANLVGNAVTHTPEGTPVHVSLRRAGDRVRLEVADEGPGLPPEQVARLFERFYRVDASRSRSRGGSGLGLSIVQAIVLASHGDVTGTSEIGRGTTFVVTLPAHS
ncbi:MAG: two-component system, OmpR family, sensor kinase [Pseudonocardiales bacterium]|nr:two-component system, OmpR family, sensor kinase [Pseudonocardiales bacterium]